MSTPSPTPSHASLTGSISSMAMLQQQEFLQETATMRTLQLQQQQQQQQLLLQQQLRLQQQQFAQQLPSQSPYLTQMNAGIY